VGILVGDAGDPELAGRATAAEWALASTDEVERFLDGLARERE
jgi:trehalose 6-phosphate phosphatase